MDQREHVESQVAVSAAVFFGILRYAISEVTP